MIPSAVAIAAAIAFGPPGSTMVDGVFAYGAIVLLIALIVWQATKDEEPRSTGQEKRVEIGG